MGCMDAHMGMKMGARVHIQCKDRVRRFMQGCPQVQKMGHKDARWDAWMHTLVQAWGAQMQ